MTSMCFSRISIFQVSSLKFLLCVDFDVAVLWLVLSRVMMSNFVVVLGSCVQTVLG